MYFKSRAEAGRILAKKLTKYQKENIAVVSLSEGGTIVGAQIAMRLHGSLSVLLTESIYLPGEHEAIAAVTSEGTFTKNNMFSVGQLEEYMAEYHGYIDEQRTSKMHQMNLLTSHDGEINKKNLRHHVVILVSDGLTNGFSLSVAEDFLKTVAIKKLIIVTPVASVDAVDRMHLVADEIYCLDVKPNYISTNHYYDDNTIPTADDMFLVMKRISTNWRVEPLLKC
jgi:predicted phosphoribosyltransferase